MEYLISSVEETSKREVIEFLLEREEYSLFLLSNLLNYGPKITLDPHSGNFKVIRERNEVVGVYSLTQNGSLLIESKSSASLFMQVLEECAKESIRIQGLFGR